MLWLTTPTRLPNPGRPPHGGQFTSRSGGFDIGRNCPAHSFAYVGLDNAKPGPGVIEAIDTCDLIIIPPSNPCRFGGHDLADSWHPGSHRGGTRTRRWYFHRSSRGRPCVAWRMHACEPSTSPPQPPVSPATTAHVEPSYRSAHPAVASWMPGLLILPMRLPFRY